jgi:hypothetical protein
VTRLQELHQAFSDALMPAVQAERQQLIEWGFACSGCGGAIEERTEGCKTCSNRDYKHAKQVKKHGVSAYSNNGCRCNVCRNAYTVWKRAQRQRARERHASML